MASWTWNTFTDGADTFPVAFTQPRGGYTHGLTVYAHISTPGGTLDVDISPDAAEYAAALAAAIDAAAHAAADRAAARAARAADPAYQAHGAVPAKPWEEKAVTLRGKQPGTKGATWWTVTADADGVFVTFPGKAAPRAEYLAAVKAAGFAWSPVNHYWRKGSNWKGYRAGLTVALELLKVDGDAVSFSRNGRPSAASEVTALLTAAKKHAAA